MIPSIRPEDFREAVKNLDPETLTELVEYIETHLVELEMDDFFGTEGINKRFA